MKFWEAMKLMDEGKKVRRASWFPKWVAYVKNGEVVLEENTTTGYKTELYLAWDDFLATDWEVFE